MASFSGSASGFAPGGYTDISSNREAGTTYTNTTGSPIQIYGRLECGTSGTSSFGARLTVGGVTVVNEFVDLTQAHIDEFYKIDVSGIVPDGSTYKFRKVNNVSLQTAHRQVLS